MLTREGEVIDFDDVGTAFTVSVDTTTTVGESADLVVLSILDPGGEDETYAYFDSVTLEELNADRTSENSRENPFKPERWLRHMIAHTNMHIGDIQYVAGMLERGMGA